MKITHSGPSVGFFDQRYLKLDASNDPITGDLLIKPSSNSATTFEVQQSDTTQVFVIDTNNARVGINMTPNQALDIDGNLKVDGFMALGSGASVNPRILLNAAETFTDGAASQNAMSFIATREITANNATFTVGILGVTELRSDDGYNYTNTIAGLGVQGRADGYTAGTMATLAGVVGYARNRSTGTVTNAYSILARDVENTGGGTITNGYGLYVQPAASATNNFAIVTARNIVVFNENGNADGDLRMESNNDANQFYLDAGTNSITIGSTTELAKFGIDGNADEIQFTVQAHSTQTNDIAVFEKSDGTDYVVISGTGMLESYSGRIVNVTTVNAATYDLLVTDHILNVTYTPTGAVTSLTLPTAQVVAGRVIVIKDAGGNAAANNITIDTQGAETIDGNATYVILSDYDSITIYSDGSNWFLI